MESPTRFQVEGPCPIAFDAPRTGTSKHIGKEHTRAFWLDPALHALRSAAGCYVFALKTGPGFSPWYVGKATKGFAQEVFTDHKLQKYNEVIYAGRKGTPVLFFVVRPGRKSAAGARQIDEVETFLIRTACRKNPELMNQAKRGAPAWGIAGVWHGGRVYGDEVGVARGFRGMMGL